MLDVANNLGQITYPDHQIAQLAVSEPLGALFVPLQLTSTGPLVSYEYYDLEVPASVSASGSTTVDWENGRSAFADGLRFMALDGHIVKLTATGPLVVHTFPSSFLADTFADNASLGMFATRRLAHMVVWSNSTYQELAEYDLTGWFEDGPFGSYVLPYRDGFIVLEINTLRNVYIPQNLP